MSYIDHIGFRLRADGDAKGPKSRTGRDLRPWPPPAVVPILLVLGGCGRRRPVEVTTSGIVLFLHVAVVVTGLMLAAVLHAALLMTRRAGSLTEYRAWAPVIGRVESLLPVTALVILGTGGGYCTCPAARRVGVTDG